MASEDLAGEADAYGRQQASKDVAPAIALRGIEKSFGAVRANRSVSLDVMPGTIHGIIGENGAGKSTLMSILYGFYEADAGSIEINGRSVIIKSPRDAIACGIGMVHQHFMLVENLTVVENIMLGAEHGFFTRRGAQHARDALLSLQRAYGLAVDPDAIIADLPVGAQQRVEILKALYRKCDILILDEPTAVLTPQETEQLFAVLKALKAQGVTILLITHKLKEILAVTDNVSVMRQGAIVANLQTATADSDSLAALMVGRKVRLDLEKAAARPGDVLLSARRVSIADASGIIRVHDVSLSLRAGEILGLAGVSGNGQGELLEALAGMAPLSGGVLQFGALAITPEMPSNPAALRALGLAHVPEDRHRLGLVPEFSAAESAMLGYQRDPHFRRGPLFDRAAIRDGCAVLMDAFDVRPRTPWLRASKFSGGNQQKLILAREIARKPKVLIVGQPTRGVDIGAIEFIHRALLDLRDAGCAILVVSAELDEIMALSDRIIVMCQGRITGEIAPRDADERTLGLMMADAKGRAA